MSKKREVICRKETCELNEDEICTNDELQISEEGVCEYTAGEKEEEEFGVIQDE